MYTTYICIIHLYFYIYLYIFIYISFIFLYFVRIRFSTFMRCDGDSYIGLHSFDWLRTLISVIYIWELIIFALNRNILLLIIKTRLV